MDVPMAWYCRAAALGAILFLASTFLPVMVQQKNPKTFYMSGKNELPDWTQFGSVFPCCRIADNTVKLPALRFRILASTYNNGADSWSQMKGKFGMLG